MRTACCRWRTTACAAMDYVNVIVADKQPHLQYLTWTQAIDALHQGHRHLGLCQQRRRRTEPDVVMACAGDIADAGIAGRGGDPARAFPGSEDPLCERGRSVPPAAGHGASAWAVGPRFRLAVHAGQAGDLQLPRVCLADPQADVPAQQPSPTSMCAGTRKKATSTRRWSWRF